MKKIFELADKYVKESNWTTMAMLKFCMLSIGVFAGVFIPDDYRKITLIVCVIVFVLTYIPLMAKLIKTAKKK
ncbi:MAG: hypothetical protein WCX81_01210 [Monoglobales bacterium]